MKWIAAFSSFITAGALLFIACKEEEPKPPINDTFSSSTSSSGGGSSTSSGSSGSSASSASSGGVVIECKLQITASGGYGDGPLNVNVCGTGGSTNFSFGSNVDIIKDTGVFLSFTLSRALKDSELGDLPIQETRFTRRLGKNDAGGFNEEEWVATQGCTVKLLSRAPRGGKSGATYADGEGFCTSSLAAVAPNTKAPVTFSAFTFRGLVPSEP